jgi:hypothetical protein
MVDEEQSEHQCKLVELRSHKWRVALALTRPVVAQKRAARRGPSLHTSKRQLSAICLRLGHAIARSILLGDRLGFAADIVVVPLDDSRTRIVGANDARPQRAEMEADCAIHVLDIRRGILSDTIHGCLRRSYRGEQRAYSDNRAGGTADQLSNGHDTTPRKQTNRFRRSHPTHEYWECSAMLTPLKKRMELTPMEQIVRTARFASIEIVGGGRHGFRQRRSLMAHRHSVAGHHPARAVLASLIDQLAFNQNHQRSAHTWTADCFYG